MLSACDYSFVGWVWRSFTDEVKSYASIVVGLLLRGELEQLAWLAFQRRADGFERGEPDCACLAGFQDRQIRECDADLLGEIGKRHATRVQDIVELHDDGHGQTVPSRSSRRYRST